MQKIQLGSSDLQVSKICLGTMTFGEQNTEAEAHSQLDYAYERGINFIDTAETYPVMPRAETQGSTERYIGTWLKKTGLRGKVVLATKAAGPNKSMTWIRNGKQNLDAALPSLGLRHEGPLRFRADSKDDKVRDLNEGYRTRAPLEYSDRVRAYVKGAAGESEK